MVRVLTDRYIFPDAVDSTPPVYSPFNVCHLYGHCRKSFQRLEKCPAGHRAFQCGGMGWCLEGVGLRRLGRVELLRHEDISRGRWVTGF